MYPPIHHAAYLGKKDDLRAELDKGVSPDLAYTEEWSHHDKTGAITVTPLHRLLETLRDYSLGARGGHGRPRWGTMREHLIDLLNSWLGSSRRAPT